MAGRPRKQKATDAAKEMAKEVAKPSNVAPLLEALNFIKVAQTEKGEAYQTHCRIIPGFIKAGNGILQAGIELAGDFEAYPDTFKLIAALSKCKETVAFTKLDNGNISIKSGPFKAVIPCVDPAILPPVMPDMSVAPLNDAFATACEIVGKAAKDSDQRLVCCSIWFTNGTCIGTDARIILEYAHGCNLPPYLIPKASIQAALSTKKQFTGIGASNSTVTFWFSDNSWIKTNIYAEPAPDQNQFFDIPNTQQPLPAGIFDAVEALIPQAKDERLYFSKGSVSTSLEPDDIGATYDLPSNEHVFTMNANYFMMIKPFVKTIDLSQGTTRFIFFGDNLRGAITGFRDTPD